MTKSNSKTGEQLAKPVAIIGAGIVGVATALWLQRDGHGVVLIDKAGPAKGASFGNGGVLASSAVVPVTVPGLLKKAPKMLFDPHQPLFLKWPYLPRLLPWLMKYLRYGSVGAVHHRAAAIKHIIGDSLADHQALAAGTPAEKWVVPSDYLYLYKDRAAYQADAFDWSIRKKQGFVWEALEGEAFREYDPCFSSEIGVSIKLPGHGRIADPGQYVKDLADHLIAKGASFIKAEVTDIVRNDGAVAGVRMGGETIDCSAVVVCTGVWSGPLASKLGLNAPLESERGYHVELWGANKKPRSPVMVSSGKFVVTPMEGRLRLAGIVEYGGLDAPASKTPIELLYKNIRQTIPGIEWKEATEWMGHRPVIADSLPLIGEVPGVKNAYCGFGHDHVGLTGGPKTGRLLAQLVSGRVPNIDLAPFAPSRF